MSPYLDRPLRSKAQVYHDILANCAETYLVIDIDRAEPFVREAYVGQSFDQVVRDIADGQYDARDMSSTGQLLDSLHGPIAVVRVSFRDNEAEIVTEKVAQAVAERIVHEARHEPELPDCPFLDEVMPDWKRVTRRVA